MIDSTPKALFLTLGDNSNASGSSGTSAGADRRSGRAESPFSSAQDHAMHLSALPADEESELTDEHGALQTSTPPINEHLHEDLPVLSRVNPRRGPTSGGDEIDLIVSNLPQNIKLYARFGSNIAPTVSGIADSEIMECDHCA